MKNSSLLTYSTSVTYTYDSDGIRGTKKVNGIKSTYHYVGGQLRYEERGNTAFYYFYDASGNLSAIRYVDSSNNVYQYYALTNAQGDVIAFYNAAGNCVVTYEYDAWGNVVNTTDDTNINFAELNPIRYRGYYYDTETGLYYLQSRYYDPEIGRFINADGYVTTGQGATSYNMFAYCGNNPVMRSDPSGCTIKETWNKIKNSFKEFFIELSKLSKSTVVKNTADVVGGITTVNKALTSGQASEKAATTKNDNFEKVISDLHTMCYTGKTASQLNLKNPDNDAFSSDLSYQQACDAHVVGYRQEMEVVYSINVSSISWDSMTEAQKYVAVQSIQEHWAYDLYVALSFAQTDDGAITP